MNPEPSLTTAQVLMLLGALQGLLLAAASFFWKHDNRIANRLFASIILILVWMMGTVGVRGFVGVPPVGAPYAIIHAWGALALCLGPLVYVHVRTSVDASYLFTWKRLVHALPALIHLSLLLPLPFVGPELRATMVERFLELELYRSLVPGIRIGFVVTSLYVLASFVWIRRFERHVTEVASFQDDLRVRWLKWFTGLLVVLLFLLGLFILRELYRVMIAGALASFMSALTFIALVRPEVFHGIPTALKLSEADPEGEKYEASQLDEEQKATHLQALLQHFETERPYLQQELTLRDVSNQINVPYRYVSQVVNEKLDRHFMDFVNGYRVEAAKRMLLDPAWSHLTIDGIAGEAGFKSRSAFYTAFKKVTGMTPGAFRKQDVVV
ncbi:MAG: helix-turn-helix domain-containing protein [Bacteroidota bacterium]